jgi:hypothetical protein
MGIIILQQQQPAAVEHIISIASKFKWDRHQLIWITSYAAIRGFRGLSPGACKMPGVTSSSTGLSRGCPYNQWLLQNQRRLLQITISAL